MKSKIIVKASKNTGEWKIIFPDISSIYGAIEQKNLQLKIQKFKNEWKNGKVFFSENLIYPHRTLFETFASDLMLPSRAVHKESSLITRP